jgi:hypothetical protein
LTRFQIVLLFGLIAMAGSSRLKAQSVTGSTTMDIDQSTNILVVTCDTDNDDSFYKPGVQCALYDASGKKVAEQANTPLENVPYAEAILTFKGLPGVIYTAMASHFVTPNITDLPTSSGPGSEEDPYNFGYFAKESATYDNYHEWYSPGPVQTKVEPPR